MCEVCNTTCQSVAGDIQTELFLDDPFNEYSNNIILYTDTATGLVSVRANIETYLWNINDTTGTISKIDTATGKEVGNYCTAIKNVAHGVQGLSEACHPDNKPSRTAIDDTGSIYISNFGEHSVYHQSVITKIAHYDVSKCTGINISQCLCVDRNNNGFIETSQDVENDGEIFTTSSDMEEFGDDWDKISTGFYHVCGIKTDGTLWCFGSNFYSALGDGTRIHRSTPVQIDTHTNWSEISVGQSFSCALRDNGTRWCWGYNKNGVLGNDSQETRTYNTPIQADTLTVWKYKYYLCHQLLYVKVYYQDDKLRIVLVLHVQHFL